MSRADFHLLLLVLLAGALAYLAWSMRGEIDYLAETVLEHHAALNGGTSALTPEEL